LARLRLLNVLICTPRRLNPCRLDFIFDLKLELAQPRSNRTVNNNTIRRVRQVHRPVAGPAIGSILHPCPEHQIFGITPIAAPEVILFVEPNFHSHVPPLIFSPLYMINITIMWSSDKIFVNFTGLAAVRMHFLQDLYETATWL
jgi:hypothetical protein